MNNRQVTDTIMMIRPSCFAFNALTAVDNVYQNSYRDNIPESEISEKASFEFDGFVNVLKSAGVNVIQFTDPHKDNTPDSIFPNNWITTHMDGSVWLYPMLSINRRAERRQDIIDYLKNNFYVKTIFNNAAHYEANDQFLEGTGSMVLDRENKIAYASLSKRTNELLFHKWCRQMNFKGCSFHATDLDKPIYHTNVLMSVCQKMVFICLDAIINKYEKKELLSLFKETGKEIIDISKNQMNKFLGNVLELKTNNNSSILVMSTSAFNVLTSRQKEVISGHCKITHSSLNTIEYFGGGSARCMITELFLEPNPSHKFKYPIFS